MSLQDGKSIVQSALIRRPLPLLGLNEEQEVQEELEELQGREVHREQQELRVQQRLRGTAA